MNKNVNQTKFELTFKGESCILHFDKGVINAIGRSKVNIPKAQAF